MASDAKQNAPGIFQKPSIKGKNGQIQNELAKIRQSLVLSKSKRYFDEVVADYSDDPAKALAQFKAQDSRSDIHPDIRQIRVNHALGANIKGSPTVAVLEADVPLLGFVKYFGISGRFGQTVPTHLRFNAIAPTHAEGRVMAQLANAMKSRNLTGGTVTIYVDKPPCGPCKGAFTTFRRECGVTLHVIAPT